MMQSTRLFYLVFISFSSNRVHSLHKIFKDWGKLGTGSKDSYVPKHRWNREAQEDQGGFWPGDGNDAPIAHNLVRVLRLDAVRAWRTQRCCSRCGRTYGDSRGEWRQTAHLGGEASESTRELWKVRLRNHPAVRGTCTRVGEVLLATYFVLYKCLACGPQVLCFVQIFFCLCNVKYLFYGVTPRPTDSTGEFEDCSDEAEELCYNSLFRIYVTPIWS